eukprot:1487366-Lingulodinium_polyedra.AAC.1
MLPKALVGNLSTACFYVRSAENPMDNPTRKRTIRPPARQAFAWPDARRARVSRRGARRRRRVVFAEAFAAVGAA